MQPKRLHGNIRRFRSWRVRLHLACYRSILGLAFAGAWGFHTICFADAPAPPPEPPPHALVTAAEALYQRKLSEACDQVINIGLATADIVDSDRVRLHLLVAMQQLAASDEAGARNAIGEGLQLDREAQLQLFASAKARELLEDVRAVLPPARRKPRPSSPPPREPPAKSLVGAIDALYQALQLDAAEVVLDLARQAAPLSKEDRVQVALRAGILRMESAEEIRAARAFQEALDLDPRARLPEYVAPKTRRVFEDVRTKLGLEQMASTTSTGKSSSGKSGGPALDPGQALLIGGGLTAGVGLVLFAATGDGSSSLTGGQVIGGVVAAVGVAALVGGVVVLNRPELLGIQLRVAPTHHGGLLLATGHF